MRVFKNMICFCFLMYIPQNYAMQRCYSSRRIIIENHLTAVSLVATYYSPDPGFRGAHVLVERKCKIKPGCRCSFDIVKKNNVTVLIFYCDKYQETIGQEKMVIPLNQTEINIYPPVEGGP